MRNNLTGIIISALLHAALFTWALAVNTDPIKQHSSDNIALTVKMFQEAIAPKAPAPVVKKIVKEVIPPTPLTPEFADLPSPQKVEPEPIKIAKVEPKVTPPPKLAKLEPIPELVKPKPIKVTKPKITKKLVVKKKTAVVKKPIKIAKKKVVKKVTPRKITKKKIIKKRKVVKKIIRKKVKRKIAQKKPKIIKKRVIAKAKPRKQAQKRPVKRRIASQKSKKVGGVYSKNQLKKQQLARQRALASKRAANKAAIQRRQAQQASKKSAARVVATNSRANVTLTKQYKARLQRLIASKKHYPKRAKRRGQQGKVTVSFRIRHSGVISDIRIIKGARNKSLNEATIAAVKKASGKLVYSKGMNKKSLTLTITLSYVLS